MQSASLRNRLKSIYGSLRFYQDYTYITFCLPGQNGDDMVEGSLDYQILFQRPNLYKMVIGEGKGFNTRSEPMHLISDGSRFIDYRPERLEYAEQKAPENTRGLFELIAALLPKHGGRHWLGLVFLFVYDDVIDALLPPTVHIHYKGSEVIEGRRVEKIVSLEQWKDAHCECTFWFDVENGLLRRFKLDIFEVDGIKRKIVSSYCENHREIQINAEINPEDFVFHPPAEGRKVEYLPSPLVSALHGKPAPEFSLPVLSGGTLSFSDLKEQVILIVCWGSGCPACPPALELAQKLYEEFADDKLCVLGVTSVSNDNELEYITQILEDKGVKFKILLDRRYEFGVAYAIWSVPRLYVINKGIVQAEFFGIPSPECIRSELQKALSGE